MAVEHAKALCHLDLSWSLITRSEKSLQFMRAQLGTKFPESSRAGGLPTQGLESFTHAVISVGVPELASVSLQAALAGVKNLLIEKPAGLTPTEILKLGQDLAKEQTQAWVGYNRRFYPSVSEAKRRIEADGGARLVQFEFSEWSHKIGPLDKDPRVKANWFLANSTHVVDLAFYLAGGWPTVLNAQTSGSLDWHKYSIYSGSGVTQNGVLFHYGADWQGPGRWGVEVTTSKRRYIFRPLETLQVTEVGSVALTPVETPTNYPGVKPGLCEQLLAFLEADPSQRRNLPPLSEIASHLDTYSKIGNL